MASKLKETFHKARHTLTEIVHNTRFGKPGVIIMGEIHTDEGHGTDQARMIRKQGPEYVLDEGLDGLNPDDTQKIVDVYKGATISDISRITGVSMEDMGISPDSLLTIRELVAQEIGGRTSMYMDQLGYTQKKANSHAVKSVHGLGKIHGTYKELVETPLYELGGKVLDYFIDVVSDKCRSSIGEEGSEVLYRKLHAIQDLASPFKHQEIENLTQNVRGRQRVYHAVADTGSKLAGCDIQKELPELNTENVEDLEHVENLINFFQDLSSYVQENNSAREQEMGRRMVEYAIKRDTNRPIIAIVGAGHINKDSGIFPVLDEAGISYRLIKQKSFANNTLKGSLYSLNLGSK